MNMCVYMIPKIYVCIKDWNLNSGRGENCKKSIAYELWERRDKNAKSFLLYGKVSGFRFLVDGRDRDGEPLIYSISSHMFIHLTGNFMVIHLAQPIYDLLV